MTERENIDLGKTRININLPNSILSKVKEYADELGINTTSAIIVLLNQAFEQKDMIKSIPLIFQTLNEVREIQVQELGFTKKDDSLE